jgi:hypothetical protein
MRIGSSKLFDVFCDDNNLVPVEGNRGLENLTKILNIIGYKDNQFKWGSAIELFLANNLEACDLLWDYIADLTDCDEDTRAAIKSELSEEAWERLGL